LLGIHHEADDEVYIFLEWISVNRRWPWVDMDATSAVIRQLAQLHALPPSSHQTVFTDTDIEHEMEESAAATAELYHQSYVARPLAGSRPMHKAIERVASDLNQMRSYLIAHTRRSAW
jgi:hypothetical protein